MGKFNNRKERITSTPTRLYVLKNLSLFSLMFYCQIRIRNGVVVGYYGRTIVASRGTAGKNPIYFLEGRIWPSSHICPLLLPKGVSGEKSELCSMRSGSLDLGNC